MNTLTQDRAYGASAAFLLALAVCVLLVPSHWLFYGLTPLVWAVIGAQIGDSVHRAKQRRAAARAVDEAQLTRAESVLLAMDDDAPPEPPPAIPVEMRDPAFAAREAARTNLDRVKREARDIMRSPYATPDQWKRLAKLEREGQQRFDELEARPLIAERRFTALTHCPKGHVATHWLGAAGPLYVERICRFEACSATWLEKT